MRTNPLACGDGESPEGTIAHTSRCGESQALGLLPATRSRGDFWWRRMMAIGSLTMHIQCGRPASKQSRRETERLSQSEPLEVRADELVTFA
jgi:hypothetical protein